MSLPWIIAAPFLPLTLAWLVRRRFPAHKLRLGLAALAFAALVILCAAAGLQFTSSHANTSVLVLAWLGFGLAGALLLVAASGFWRRLAGLVLVLPMLAVSWTPLGFFVLFVAFDALADPVHVQALPDGRVCRVYAQGFLDASWVEAESVRLLLPGIEWKTASVHLAGCDGRCTADRLQRACAAVE